MFPTGELYSLKIWRIPYGIIHSLDWTEINKLVGQLSRISLLKLSFSGVCRPYTSKISDHISSRLRHDFVQLEFVEHGPYEELVTWLADESRIASWPYVPVVRGTADDSADR